MRKVEFLPFAHTIEGGLEALMTAHIALPKVAEAPDLPATLSRRILTGALRDELGFDGMVLNEHHQNIYGLMPSPNLLASALTQKTKNAKIVILGNLPPLYLNPLRVAEEYAMLDNMSDGRLIAGFAVGGVPPLGHTDPLPTLIDASLARFKTVYAAAGSGDTIFPIAYETLVEVTHGKVHDLTL